MATDDTPDYKTYYEEKWAEHFEDEDGNLDKDAVMRELYDFGHMIKKFQRFIHFATAGRASDPTVTIESLQQLAIAASIETAKAAIVQELEHLEDLILQEDTDFHLLADTIHAHKDHLNVGVQLPASNNV